MDIFLGSTIYDTWVQRYLLNRNFIHDLRITVESSGFSVYMQYVCIIYNISIISCIILLPLAIAAFLNLILLIIYRQNNNVIIFTQSVTYLHNIITIIVGMPNV